MQYQNARILYAEDDADTREVVTVILEGKNCQVIATESAAEALPGASRTFRSLLNRQLAAWCLRSEVVRAVA